MAIQPLRQSNSSSPESEDVWDNIFRADRSTQPDFEGSEEDLPDHDNFDDEDEN